MNKEPKFTERLYATGWHSSSLEQALFAAEFRLKKGKEKCYSKDGVVVEVSLLIPNERLRISGDDYDFTAGGKEATYVRIMSDRRSNFYEDTIQAMRRILGFDSGTS